MRYRKNEVTMIAITTERKNEKSLVKRMHWERLFHVIKRDLYIEIKIKYTKYIILPTYLYVQITKTTLSHLLYTLVTFVPSAFFRYSCSFLLQYKKKIFLNIKIQFNILKYPRF